MREIAPLCRPIWQLSATTTVSSELVLVETLVSPLRTGDTALQTARETLWRQPNTRLLPITAAILRDASQLRANIPGLKTPDAIHAATALTYGCAAFVTNDTGFRRIPNLPLILLDDLLP